ncbi:acetolactate synthase I/II/III large subunit [Xylogone sp. PMI_703]|nr:acetolactate synthase I/II/III large subunit [Xylogone sp. PMI_703]
MQPLNLQHPKHRELSGGDLLAQCLRALGVEVAFGIHGGHLDAFLVGCAEADIRLVDTRHETVAVQAAEGYAKVSGKVGVAFVTANSGFANGLPGLASAIADRSPIFVVTSSPPLRDAETNCLQGFLDQVVVAKPLTKFAHRVVQVEEIPRLVAHAFRVATAGAPGPVLIDFPIDILFRPVQLDQISWGSIGAPLPLPPAPNSHAISQTVNLWKAAKRPVLIIGSGSRTSEISKELLSLVETTQTPVFQSQKGFGTFPIDHPLQAGLAGNLVKLLLGNQPQPDLVIMLGARTGMFLAGRTGAILPSNGCKYVQVDTDAGEIGRQIPVDVGIVSDVLQALISLNKEAEKHPFRAPQEWTAAASKLKTEPNPFEKDQQVIDGRLHPHFAAKTLLSSLEPGSIICIDGGECGGWTTEVLEVARPSQTLFAAGYLGMLGNGYGYALGASVAAPTRQVINIQGDGSAGFHIAELDTYARHQLNILTVVYNNQVWGMSQHGQDLVYGEKTPARPVSSLSPKMAFHKAAEGFGVKSARVNDLKELEKTVKQFGKTRDPALIEMIVSDKPVHPSTIAMVSATDDPNWIVVPYYDNIPRPFYKTANIDGSSKSHL